MGDGHDSERGKSTAQGRHGPRGVDLALHRWHEENCSKTRARARLACNGAACVLTLHFLAEYRLVMQSSETNSHHSWTGGRRGRDFEDLACPQGKNSASVPTPS